MKNALPKRKMLAKQSDFSLCMLEVFHQYIKKLTHMDCKENFGALLKSQI
jgi:hypothetical protein